MADFVNVMPCDLAKGDVVILARLDDDFNVEDYDAVVREIEHPRPQRYRVTFEGGEQQYFGSRARLRVRT